MKILVLAAIAGFTLAPMKGDTRQQYLVGDTIWLSTAKCSFSDPVQCALELHMKKVLRRGPVKIEN